MANEAPAVPIVRTMMIQVATKVTFKDNCDEGDNPPYVRIYDYDHQFMWKVTPEKVLARIPAGECPPEILFHARQFLYDNHPELGPQPIGVQNGE